MHIPPDLSMNARKKRTQANHIKIALSRAVPLQISYQRLQIFLIQFLQLKHFRIQSLPCQSVPTDSKKIQHLSVYASEKIAMAVLPKLCCILPASIEYCWDNSASGYMGFHMCLQPMPSWHSNHISPYVIQSCNMRYKHAQNTHTQKTRHLSFTLTPSSTQSSQCWLR